MMALTVFQMLKTASEVQGYTVLLIRRLGQRRDVLLKMWAALAEMSSWSAKSAELGSWSRKLVQLWVVDCRLPRYCCCCLMSL